jgi:integrase
MGKLTDLKCKSAKPRGKVYKLFDGEGLFLLIKPSGKKHWRYAYVMEGKERLLALGEYPYVSLVEARQAHFDALKLKKRGIDPVHHKQRTLEAGKEAERQRQAAMASTFRLVALEWYDKKAPGWRASYQHKIKTTVLENNLFPWLGDRPIADIDPPELLRVVRIVEGRGATILAAKCKQVAGAVFRYGVSTGRCNRDPSQDLRDVIQTSTVTHHAAILDPVELGALLRAMHGYQGNQATCCALKLMPLVFVRPGELRAAEWAEIDLGAALWIIPSGKMKMAADHVVPLSQQAVEILQTIKPLTGGERYVFPSEVGKGRPMSNNTLNAALKRLGYTSEQITPHGFRAVARTLLDENLGFRVEWIEQQLAHTVKDPLGRAYNRTKHLDERAKMMQAWADYLDGLRHE